MKDVKIVFIDIDGTLRDNSGHISIEYNKIMEKLKSIGIYVVLSTGRSVIQTKMISKEINASNYVICSNGAEIYNYLNNNVILENSFDSKNIDCINNIINKYNLNFICNTIDFRYSNKDIDNVGLKKIISILDIKESINQVVLLCDNKDLFNTLFEEINNIDGIKVSNHSKNLDSNDLYLDITRSDVSKASAVKVLCDYLKIDINKSMGIGDSINDIEMLNSTGYKVCVNNASDEVKKICDYVTLSNDADGALVVLNRLYEELIK